MGVQGMARLIIQMEYQWLAIARNCEMLDLNLLEMIVARIAAQ